MDVFHVTSLLFSGEVYILASSKSMAQSHSGKLYKLVDPKRYNQEVVFLFSLGGWSKCVTFFYSIIMYLYSVVLGPQVSELSVFFTCLLMRSNFTLKSFYGGTKIILMTMWHSCSRGSIVTNISQQWRILSPHRSHMSPSHTLSTSLWPEPLCPSTSHHITAGPGQHKCEAVTGE